MNDFIWLKDKQGNVSSSLLAASHYDSHNVWYLPDLFQVLVVYLSVKTQKTRA